MTDANVEVVAVESGALSEDAGPTRFFGHLKGRPKGRLQRLRKFLHNKKHEEFRTPVNTVLSLVCDLGCLSFRAYNDPSNTGFSELTTTGCRVRHLNYDILNASVEGVLKIHLERAEHVLDADFGPGRSDPYVVFSTGWSQVASSTVQNTDSPVWNSTHYLLIRKPGAIKRDDNRLTIRLFDSDIAWGDNAERVFRQFLIRDDFLGSASIDLEELKRPGVVQTQDLVLHLEGDHREQKTIVHFTTEFLSFANACTELGREEHSSGTWAEKVDDDRNFRWSELPVDTHVGHIIFRPVAFINCMRTGTQVWIHCNTSEKALAVAFRGTEANRLKDLITDLNFIPRRLDWKNDGTCTLRLTETAMLRGIRVHSGFRGAYQSIWSTLLTIVENVTQWRKDWTVCTTGHSLGGALATLCAFEYANRQNDKGETPHIVMMNFGAPRVGNREFAQNYRITVPESYRIVNRLDIIHKIPIFLKHVKREIAFEEDGEVIVDKRQSIRLFSKVHQEEMENVHTGDASEEEEELPKSEKLTKRGLFKTPGFKGHFENYYFDVVTRAIGSFFDEQTEQLQYLLNGMKQTKERREHSDDEEEFEEAHTLPPGKITTPESSHTPTPKAAESSDDASKQKV